MSESIEVLIVDDSAAMRVWLKRVIGMAGLPFGPLREAGNGFEALLAMRKSVPGFLFLDVNMPIMNGIDLLKAMRGTPELSDVPVLVVSTEGSETRLAEIRAAGAGFIRKPFTPEQMIEAFHDLTGRKYESGGSGAQVGGGPDF